MATMTAKKRQPVGDMVNQREIDYMNAFIKAHGHKAFMAAVFFGAFSSLSFDYIHPCDEMRSTEGFEDIQKAFINAYV